MTSIIELMNELHSISNLSGLKPNEAKCEITGIGVLNGVQVALCGMKCVNLNSENIFVVHFSFNKNLEQDKKIFRAYCQNKKHFQVMTHKTVNFVRKNYALQLIFYGKPVHFFLTKT